MRGPGFRIVGRAAAWSIAFLVLGAVTQVGAVILVLAIPAWRYAERGFRPTGPGRRVALRSGVFLALYAAASAFVVPPLAVTAGRAPLPCDLSDRTPLGPATLWTCILNRHYVAAGVDIVLGRVAGSLSQQAPGARIGYLDAGFPFSDAFPMVPHLSHRHGRAVDLPFLYIDAATGALRPAPSPFGYWGYVQPRPGEPRPCAGKESWLRWDMDWLQPFLDNGHLDEAGTAALIKALADSPDVTRIFLEPHLKVRLGLGHSKVRFQGCRAARHDDHLHVEFARIARESP